LSEPGAKFNVFSKIWSTSGLSVSQIFFLYLSSSFDIMESPQPLPTFDEAINVWKEALKEDDSAEVPARIEEACRSCDYHGLLKMDPFPDFSPRRNILHFIIFESDGCFKPIEEKFRLPVVKAMVETAPGKKARKYFVNKPDNNKVSPLHMAAMEGHVDIACYLINQGAVVKSTSRTYATPLHWAAEHVRAGMVSLLLQRLGENYRMQYDDDLRSPLDALEERMRMDHDEQIDHNEAIVIRQLLSRVVASNADGEQQQHTPSKTLRCQLVALGDPGGDYDDQVMLDKQVSEVIEGFQPLLQVMRDRLVGEEEDEEKKIEGTEVQEEQISRPPKRWGAYGVSLPQKNVSESKSQISSHPDGPCRMARVSMAW
jgi:hypothetical protein